MVTPFADLNREPAIRGFLHLPPESNGSAIALTHGAGSNCQAKLLVEMSSALALSGFTVLRFDLPFRSARPQGPPRPGSAERDREGLRRAVSIMREKTGGHLFLGGHSYGGRQSTILVAEEPGLVEGLLLLSYPLHPPRKPSELRTSHFPKLSKPCLFVHGTRDPFGTIAEMQSALKLVPAQHAIFEVDGAGHELLGKKAAGDLPARVAMAFQAFLGKAAVGPTTAS
jgi:predicted alpha/beta-hydrolase family hydrolase